MRSLAVVTAGLSTPSATRRLADAIAAATQSAITARGEAVEIQVIELRELAHEMADAMTSWDTPTPHLDSARARVLAADGMIAVTPAFQGSFSGMFKMFFDTFKPTALENKPTLIAATGGSTRHAMMLDYAMRPLFNYLHAVVVPTGIFLVAADCDGSNDPGESERRIRTAATQLADAMVTPTDRVGGLSGINDRDSTRTGEKARGTQTPKFTPLGEMLKVTDPRG
ncbi:oxidoreductase [Corynebacterium phocae]|uniref:Oxidoreductase n=1 Tax=Corynebacterium phocae TaxID=161895 RepID=A0A1L7D2X8_9CORY|nr:CE1759 family FMN reductase [Corynebacterium phocae]APT92433.1 oxidoreductase [Corynebacterium phocae]KAA8725034.1 oxidoreductase [Corynebacterium phocae]